jgi:HD-GYP domain-containing protein (c-di-GMP phosphodiesterase class II)
MISTQLLQAIRSQPEEFVGFILGGNVKGYEMAKSSVNTAILSGLVAHELKYPNHKTLSIIIGALLHDAGMLRLPKEITEKRGELSDPERKLMHTHPLLAYKIITKEFKYNEEVGTVVLQHHERWDGNG